MPTLACRSSLGKKIEGDERNPNPKEQWTEERGTHQGSSASVTTAVAREEASLSRKRTSRAAANRRIAGARARAQRTAARPLDGGALTLGRARVPAWGPAAVPSPSFAGCREWLPLLRYARRETEEEKSEARVKGGRPRGGARSRRRERRRRHLPQAATGGHRRISLGCGGKRRERRGG